MITKCERNKVREKWLLRRQRLAGLFDYAKEVIKGRWPEAEPYLINNWHWSLRYAKEIIKGRWYEAEPIILQSDTPRLCEYARDAIKGRWPEAEPLILQDRISIIHYARDVIKGRWPEGEEVIKEIPVFACAYAIDIIKDRWLEAEELMTQSDAVWDRYTQFLESLGKNIDTWKVEGDWI